MERVTGIEPASVAWEAAVLPLNYTRIRYVKHTVLSEFATPIVAKT